MVQFCHTVIIGQALPYQVSLLTYLVGYWVWFTIPPTPAHWFTALLPEHYLPPTVPRLCLPCGGRVGSPLPAVSCSSCITISAALIDTCTALFCFPFSVSLVSTFLEHLPPSTLLPPAQAFYTWFVPTKFLPTLYLLTTCPTNTVLFPEDLFSVQFCLIGSPSCQFCLLVLYSLLYALPFPHCSVHCTSG